MIFSCSAQLAVCFALIGIFNREIRPDLYHFVLSFPCLKKKLTSFNIKLNEIMPLNVFICAEAKTLLYSNDQDA